MRRTISRQSGFTLIELMIVVAIIGILASIAVPQYQDYVARAQFAEGLSLASGQQSAVAEVFVQTGNCPLNSGNASDGIASATDINGSYVEKVVTAGTASTSGGCTITAHFKRAIVSKGIAGQTVTLTMTNADLGSIKWSCRSSAAQRYVPRTCTTFTSKI